MSKFLAFIGILCTHARLKRSVSPPHLRSHFGNVHLSSFAFDFIYLYSIPRSRFSVLLILFPPSKDAFVMLYWFSRNARGTERSSSCRFLHVKKRFSSSNRSMTFLRNSFACWSKQNFGVKIKARVQPTFH